MAPNRHDASKSNSRMGAGSCLKRNDPGCLNSTTRFHKPYSKYCLAKSAQVPLGRYSTTNSGSNHTVSPDLRSRQFNS